MQRPNELKRRKITDTAAKLFARRPFHKVRLDDVAAAAHVGKGTLYVYFKSKEDLYASLVLDGFSRLVDRLEERMADDDPPPQALELVVREIVAYAFDRPYIFELMRFIDPGKAQPVLSRKRRRLAALVENILLRGNGRGDWHDPHPALTAVFIPGFVRSAVLYGPKDLDEAALTAHILRLLRRGMTNGEAK